MYSDIRWITDLVDTGKITVDQAREIVNAETIEILYANNEPCIILIRNAGEPTKEIGLYSEDYETHKLEMVKVNATLQEVVELCIRNEISYQDAQLWYRKVYNKTPNSFSIFRFLRLRIKCIRFSYG